MGSAPAAVRVLGKMLLLTKVLLVQLRHQLHRPRQQPGRQRRVMHGVIHCSALLVQQQRRLGQIDCGSAVAVTVAEKQLGGSGAGGGIRTGGGFAVVDRATLAFAGELPQLGVAPEVAMGRNRRNSTPHVVQ